ncbi:hypothetical protein Glove_52g18 [Diversispora epigaea]|uniref:Uncharacterized protein n=1 Tax=Diversispora epigaea TaxID=1348612 RepID=A0A397JGJ0_9GLOM|nr:hypothetical protein Glove_52g18 [Diversispora epigaea]
MNVMNSLSLQRVESADEVYELLSQGVSFQHPLAHLTYNSCALIEESDPRPSFKVHFVYWKKKMKLRKFM